MCFKISKNIQSYICLYSYDFICILFSARYFGKQFSWEILTKSLKFVYELLIVQILKLMIEFKDGLYKGNISERFAF